MRDQNLAELAQRIAGGDQDALAKLYDETNRLVYSLVYRVLGEHSTAEEVTMDVYMQVWRQAARFDAARGALLTWLLTIARSRAIDRRRASRLTQQRTEQLDLSEGQQAARSFANIEEAALLSERGRVVQAALLALPAEQREVIELGYFLGLSHREIAERLKQPLGTVKTRARLGMMKLRETLKPKFEHGL
jgi:RNA polymerase sigma-70 factor (ECF subfamily)